MAQQCQKKEVGRKMVRLRQELRQTSEVLHVEDTMTLFEETKETTCSFILRCLTMRFKSSSLCQPIVIGLKKKNIIWFNREIIINKLSCYFFVSFMSSKICILFTNNRCRHFQVPAFVLLTTPNY